MVIPPHQFFVVCCHHESHHPILDVVMLIHADHHPQDYASLVYYWCPFVLENVKHGVLTVKTCHQTYVNYYLDYENRVNLVRYVSLAHYVSLFHCVCLDVYLNVKQMR